MKILSKGFFLAKSSCLFDCTNIPSSGATFFAKGLVGTASELNFSIYCDGSLALTENIELDEATCENIPPVDTSAFATGWA